MILDRYNPFSIPIVIGIVASFSPVGTICVVAHPDINISSLPNQRQMRLDEYAFGIRHDLAGLKRRQPIQP